MKINEKGFWENQTLEGHCYDKQLSEAMVKFFKSQDAKYVVDFGCGHGQYVNYLNDNNIKSIGFDGNPYTSNFSKFCSQKDLTENIDLSEKPDWILCLEVGEHIPEKYEHVLINNIHKNNKNGVLLSWAVEGQGGDGHVNCKNNEYIKNIFVNLGYTNLLEEENKLRDFSSLSWFKNTIMVFKNDNSK